MEELLERKAESCPEFVADLCATEGSILVEATNNKYWGSGHPGIAHTLAVQPKYWRGYNMLGRLLMKLRQKLLKEVGTSDEDGMAMFSTPQFASGQQRGTRSRGSVDTPTSEEKEPRSKKVAFNLCEDK